MYKYVNDFDTVELQLHSVVTTGFGKTLKFIIHKYAKFLLHFMKGCLYSFSFKPPTLHMYMYKPVALYRFKNNDIPGRGICTLSSQMRVSPILQLFSPPSLNVTILRRIYGGILITS
jgi:hypothetical protein